MDLEFEEVEAEIIFYIYGAVRTIERPEAIISNEYYLGKLADIICPECQMNIVAELDKINYQLARFPIKEEQKNPYQFQMDRVQVYNDHY